MEQSTSGVDVCYKEDAENREWITLETIATDGEANADAILDIKDQFCFVR